MNDANAGRAAMRRSHSTKHQTFNAGTNVQLNSDLPLGAYEQDFWAIDRLIAKNYPQRGPIVVETDGDWYVRHPDARLGPDDLPKLVDEISYLGVPGLSLAGLIQVPSAGFRALAALRTARQPLELLDLFNTRIAGADFVASLEGLSELRSLNLAGTAVSGETLGELVHSLPNLRKLHLGWTQIDDDALAVVTRLERLTDLDLRETRVTGCGLRSLRALPQLRCLGLQGLPITDHDIEALAELPLTRLDLSHTAITNQSLVVLTTLPTLRTLVLRGTRISLDQYPKLRDAAPGLETSDAIVD